MLPGTCARRIPDEATEKLKYCSFKLKVISGGYNVFLSQSLAVFFARAK